MSEFHVTVERIGKFGKHPNADTLSITQIKGRYPVIFKSGAFKEGDLVVHIPPDALVPVERPEFSFLADKAVNGLHRVRFSKIRQVPSYGFFVPVPEGADVKEGDDVRELLGVTKYDPGPCFQLAGDVAGDFLRLPQEGVVPLYDIEALRKYEGVIPEGEEVVVTEKIHGSNGRWVVLDGELFCGSRTKFRVNSVWNRMAAKYKLDEVLGANSIGGNNQGLVLYGEVFGPGIQDLAYGAAEPDAVFFDIYDSRTGRWWNWAHFESFCLFHKLPYVPVLHRGAFKAEEMYAMAEGKTVLGNGAHVREGVVIKPTQERWDQKIGRVFLKLVGEGYLLRKGG